MNRIKIIILFTFISSLLFSQTDSVKKTTTVCKNPEGAYINFNYTDSLVLIPNTTLLKDTLYGVINVSVADIRTQNKFTAGMATQALLGTPIKLFDKDEWFYIQMPDKYYGWANARQVVPMNKQDYNKWITAPKIIFTNHYGFAYATPDKDGEVVSDLVSGNTLRFLGISGDYFKVAYPDNRIAYILKNESQEYATWLQSREPSVENFLKVAKSIKGVPYVWGGTSSKGVDCSGLISLTMRLHGLFILRDASQQATIGLPVDISTGYENLQVGDLMFFGKVATEDQKEKIRHVGFYLGNNKFLHASGYNRINSLNPDDEDYDELNTREFVKASRIIDNGTLHGIEKTADNEFYQIQK